MLAGYKYRMTKKHKQITSFSNKFTQIFNITFVLSFLDDLFTFSSAKVLGTVLFTEGWTSRIQNAGQWAAAPLPPSLPSPLSFFCPWLADTGKWFHSHANPARAPVIHTANYTSGLGTLTCWHHTGILAWEGRGECVCEGWRWEGDLVCASLQRRGKEEAALAHVKSTLLGA